MKDIDFDEYITNKENKAVIKAFSSLRKNMDIEVHCKKTNEIIIFDRKESQTDNDFVIDFFKLTKKVVSIMKHGNSESIQEYINLLESQINILNKSIK